MAVKTFDVPDIGTVHVYRRRGTRHMRLSVDREGKVRVTMPMWTPYKAALLFVGQKQAWIAEHKSQHVSGLRSGQRIGKYHTLYIEPDPAAERVRTRITTGAVYVYHPPAKAPEDAAVQKSAQTAAQRALRRQAEQLLPQRLHGLAAQHDFSFRSVSVRNLKTRWGSCDSQQHITLNYYLMQLPWGLIDYVLVHELAHTRHLNHSPEFWQEVADYLPDYKARRKALKEYQPSAAVPLPQPFHDQGDDAA